MIYLASPYSHPDALIRKIRYQAACRATAALIRSGRTVFSPIVHGHALVPFGLPTDWFFWEPHARKQLARSDEFVVLMLDGWAISTGVTAELRIAGELGLPVRYLDPKEA